jgi:C1A family cysteine protease
MNVAIIDGKRRGLGLLLPPKDLVCDLPVFGDVVEPLDQNTLKRIAQSQTSVGRTLFDRSFIKNQGQYGSCNGFAGAAALTRARIRRGLKRVDLSGAYLYSLINGGQDNGSHLSAGMRTLADKGCATEATVAWNKIYPSKYDRTKANREAAKHKAFECYRIDNAAELWTALALGWDVVVAVHVGSRFSKLNSNGIAGVDSGRGNHAVMCDGLLYVGGEIVGDGVNSWGTGWGDRGRMLLRWSHFKQTIGIHSFYAIRSASDGDNKPPRVR